MITYNFDIYKIRQIINYVLKKHSGAMNYTALIKLLYIADRECLKQCGFTITQDSYRSMTNGPVLSTTYNLILNKHNTLQAQWDALFVRDGYDLKLLYDNNLGNDQLNDLEIGILDDVYNKFKDWTYSDLIDYTHKQDIFPEVRWKEAADSCTSIPLAVEDMCKALRYSDADIAMLDAEIQAQERMKLNNSQV